MSTDSVHVVLYTIHVDSPLFDAVSLSCDVVPSENDVSDELLGFSQPEEIDWGRVQRDDPVLSLIFDPSVSSKVRMDPHGERMLRHRRRLCILDGVICRRREVDGATYPMLLPEEYQKRALGGCHDDVGHMGRDKTLSLMRERFYWPSMAEDVAVYVSQCDRYLRRSHWR